MLWQKRKEICLFSSERKYSYSLEIEEYSGFQVKLTTDQFTRITSVFKTQSLYK